MVRPGLLIAPGLLVAAACLGGCGYTPEQLGITGPGTAHTALPSHASEAEKDSIIANPGLPAGFGDRYGPSMTPSYGQNGRFYGYN
jgi:hypothetical protein